MFARMRLSIAIALLGLAACKRGAQPPAPPPAPAAPAATTAHDAAAAAQVPRDPRLAELFASGRDCTWNDAGLTSCDAAKQLQELAFQNQNDDQLAAGCAAALRDPAPTTRGLAAVCLRGFTDRTRTPLLAAGIDAFEAEQDPKLRHAISWAFASCNAREAGLEPRVIALVEKLVAAGDDDGAANFLDSMFPQYLIQSTPAPSRAAGELALALARKAGPHTQTRALEDIGLLVDRKPEVCAALGDAVHTAQWSPAIATLTKFPADCAAQLDAAVDVLAAQMRSGTYDPVMKQLVTRVALTPAQVGRLAPASRQLVRKAPDWAKQDARALAKLLAPYHPPAKR